MQSNNLSYLKGITYLVESVQHLGVEVESLVEKLQHVALDVRLLLGAQLERLDDVVEADLPDVELDVVRLAEDEVGLEEVLKGLAEEMQYWAGSTAHYVLGICASYTNSNNSDS